MMGAEALGSTLTKDWVRARRYNPAPIGKRSVPTFSGVFKRSELAGKTIRRNRPARPIMDSISSVTF
jgi:hypothetical protein